MKLPLASRVSLLLLAILAAGPALAQTTMKDVIGQLSWKNAVVSLDFYVRRGDGPELHKKMKVYVADSAAGQDLHAVFTWPANMKGTAFLALTRDDRSDEYYLYLRTLRRVKRVPNSTENFMLRDFLSLYFLKPRPELWSFSAATPVTLDGQSLLKFESTARDSKTTSLSGYTRLIHYVDPEKKAIVKTEFYDGDKLIRLQKVDEFLKIKGTWFPTVFSTEDRSEGVSARIEAGQVDLDATVPDDIFTVRHLKQL